jgi:hypothetical protein
LTSIIGDIKTNLRKEHLPPGPSPAELERARADTSKGSLLAGWVLPHTKRATEKKVQTFNRWSPLTSWSRVKGEVFIFVP